MKQLEADEDFFTNSKQSCRAKAGEWASRTRLRTQELATMTEALKIMEDPATKANFDKATEFLQVSSKSSGTGHSQQKQAFAKLRSLATETHNLAIARIAASVRSGGHFDKVIVTIDGLITTMREEEADDIKHRDRCEKDQGANKNDMEDLEHSIDKTKKSITRMEGEGDALQTKMDDLETEIEATKKDLEDRLEMRNKEKEEFLKAVQADAKAVEALNAAIGVLSSFYAKNKLLLQLGNVKVNSTATENQTIQVNKTGTVSVKANATVAAITAVHKTEQKKTEQKTVQKTQQKKGDPEYADAPPETTFSGGAKKGESGGIIDMLGMIVTDLEMETKTARQADVDAQVEYEKDRKAMNDMLLSQKDSLASMEKEHADLLVKIADYEEFKEQRKTDLEGEKEEEEALKADCDWIAEHFEDRRIARKKEMEGLVEAKNYLAGVDSGESLDFD